MKVLNTICKYIDCFTEWSGQTVKWLVLALIAIMSYEVIARYIFNSPTAWAFDLSYMIGGSFMILGGAYVLLHEGHIRIDLLYNRLSEHKRKIIDLVLTLLVFFPVMAILLSQSYGYAYHSWLVQERSRFSIWEPIVFPFKWAIFIGFLLLTIEGVSWFLHSLAYFLKRSSHD